MGPPKKEQLEKGAWVWVESTSPSQITQEHMEMAYRVKLKICKLGSCRRNCRSNPCCLSGLGERTWLGEIQEESWNEIEDPNIERRKDGSFVGLKNLGATCYVNSLLQLWYHNLDFRRAIYSWEPEADLQEKENSTLDTDNYEPISPVGHLQIIFTLLQFSKRRYIDPSPFILSLGLDTMTQQDAQEFSKLCISMLEGNLSHQKNAFVSQMVQHQFCGEYAYVTTCSSCKNESMCPSKFYELDLNIKGHIDLSESLQEFLKEEQLEGANQYFCSICSSKQNAIRCISLKMLPPVLNLQLLRFIFDRQTGVKKKLNSFIHFPEVLDLSEYLSQPKGTHLYELSAVLIHRGPTAYSGHYIAHIKQRNSSTWYKFNDEVVEKMEGRNLKLCTEDDVAEGVKKQKQPKLPKGHIASNSAYMLVYSNKSPPCVIEAAAEETWNIPQRLQSSVERDNQKFEDWIAEVSKLRDQNVQTGMVKQTEIQELYHKLPVLGKKEYEFVPAVWLTQWLTGDREDSAINNHMYLCRHKKLDPDKVTKMKCISKEAANVIFTKYGGGPHLTEKALCWDCVRTKCAAIRMKSKTNEDHKEITNLLKLKISCDEHAFWIGRAHLRSWRKLVLEEYGDSVNDLSMMNGQDRESESTGPEEERIGVEGVNDAEVKSSKSEEPMVECKLRGQCVEDNMPKPNTVQMNSSEVSSSSDAKTFTSNKKLAAVITGDSLLCGESEVSSTSDIHDCSEQQMESQDIETLKEEEEGLQALGFNEGIVCEHGKLCIEEGSRRLVQEKVWNILKSYFPDAPEFSREAEVCLQCQNLACEDEQTRSSNKQLATEQKAALQDLYLDRNRPTWARTDLQQVYVVSREFVESWRKFVRDPAKKDPVTSVDNQSLLCEHGGLLYEPEIAAGMDSSSRLYLIWQQEWQLLTALFPVDAAISLTRVNTDNGPLFCSEPAACESCVMARHAKEQQQLLDYKSAVIFVRKVTNETGSGRHSPQAQVPGPREDDDPEFQGIAAKKQKLGNCGEVRRSSRHRKVRGEKEVKVSSTQSLRDLKLQIMKLFSVAPFDQHLSMNGSDLNDNQASLASLNIIPGCLLLLRVDEPCEEHGVMEDYLKDAHPEEGFKGTELLRR